MYDANNRSALLIASIAITDTSVHTYRTDPMAVNDGVPSGIDIIPAMFQREPKPYTVAIYVQNTGNEELTVVPIGNIDSSKTYLDYNIGSGTIAAGGADILYIYMQGANAFPSEYMSLALSYATAPTSGSVTAYVLFYGE